MRRQEASEVVRGRCGAPSLLLRSSAQLVMGWAMMKSQPRQKKAFESFSIS
jgi:hypothetical protein